jgi:hypothetical protein
MKCMTASLLACIALIAHSAPAAADLGYCTPAPDCSTTGKPCNKSIQHGITSNLALNPAPVGNGSVIRVRLCTKTDALCSDYNTTQSVTVHGFVGGAEIYTKNISSLNPNDIRDTGPYTQLPRLTKLSATCGNAGAESSCKIVWQHCRTTLPLQTP